jgi:hypothetical protein
LLAALAERDQRVASDQQRFDSENAEIAHLRSQLGYNSSIFFHSPDQFQYLFLLCSQTNDILREAEARVDELHLQVMQAHENTRKAEANERNMERLQSEAIQRAGTYPRYVIIFHIQVD